MTISSALAAGVSGLNANAQKLAGISDNIANSSTFGYKRTLTDFHSMVIDTGTDARYSAGGVRSSTTRLIDERGQIQATNNSTDIAINGRGFLPVAGPRDIDGGAVTKVSLMTTSSFEPDKAGVLTDATGNVLLGWPAAQDGSVPSFPRDSVDGLEPVNIFHNQYSANPTSEMTVHLNLPSDDTEAGAPGTAHDVTLEYFGNLGQTETLNVIMTPVVPAAGASNEWTMQITDSASADAVVAEYRITFSDANTGGGTMTSVTTVTGNDYVQADGTVDVDVAGGTITMNIGELGDTAGITQLNSSFAPSYLSKNGSSVGNLLGVEIDDAGVVRAVYDSGFTRSIYQVPVIDVANANGLTSSEGQTYQISADSGDLFLWDAGDGPVGQTVGYAREASTTDVAVELTNLIQTQRSYSSNAKIIQTVDEMLQETTNLKR